MSDRRQQQSFQFDGGNRIDALYSWLSYDLQRMREDILKELKYSAVQTGSMYQEMNKTKDDSARAITQEIRFSYKQNQTIYDGLAKMLTEEVGGKIGAMEEQFSAFTEIREINDKLFALLSDTVLPKMDKLAQMEELLKKVDLAIAALPVDTVDYTRIAEEVGDRVLELFNDARANQASVVEEIKNCVDYDKIIDSVAEKVVESVPYPEKVDYRKIESLVERVDYDKIESLVERVDYDRIQTGIENAVANTLKAESMDALASAVAQKVVVPAPEIDYDRLADMVAARISVPAIDYDALALKVAKALAENSEQDYDVILDKDGVEHIADKVYAKVAEADIVDYDKMYQVAQAAQLHPETVDYDRIAEIVEQKISAFEVLTYEPIPEEPVVEEIVEETPVEETVAEEVKEEEPVEEVAEEIVEEVIESASDELAVAEDYVEEIVEEAPIQEEVVEEPVQAVEKEAPEAVAQLKEELASTLVYNEVGDDLVDAETGLVIRLKKSFTAKMRQSEEVVKGYYSDLKNELTSYKRINSNVSWHGDRFNYGRETIAKINILGKTLCFYLALDPNDPEFKTTVYHQKDVSNQKAYESTPFMVKIKSDAAAKKALRLVGYLAEKVGATKEEGFEAVDYVEEFSYQSTKQLFEDGFIKATKEKKVDLDF